MMRTGQSEMTRTERTPPLNVSNEKNYFILRSICVFVFGSNNIYYRQNQMRFCQVVHCGQHRS